MIRGLSCGTSQPGPLEGTYNKSSQVHGVSLHGRQGSGAVQHDNELVVASEAGTHDIVWPRPE